MAVTRESIVAALKDLEGLEEVTLHNLESLVRKCRQAKDERLRRRAISLLRRLQDDGPEHRALLARIAERLGHGTEG